MDTASTVFYTLEEAYIHPTLRKIERFRNFVAGWHYNEGVPFKEDTLSLAIQIHEMSIDQGLYETDAFPGIDGEIMITIYHYNQYLEFTVEQNGQISYVKEIGDEEVAGEEKITTNTIKSLLITLREDVWKQSELLTGNTTTEERTDLSALRSRTQATMGESQLLARNVFSKVTGTQGQFAPTFNYSMKELQVSPQFTGSSKLKIYQAVTS